MMRKILCVLSALLLFILPLAFTAAQQEMPGMPGVLIVPEDVTPSAPTQPDAVQFGERLLQMMQSIPADSQQPAAVPAAPPRNAEQPRNAASQSAEPLEQARLNFQQAVHELLGVSAIAYGVTSGRPNDPAIWEDLREAIQNYHNAAQRLQRTATPASQPTVDPLDPFAAQSRQSAPPQQSAARPAAARNPEPLTAEREKAYIALARQYFFVFTSTPVEPPVTLRSLAEQMTVAVPTPAAENGDDEAEEVIDPKEEWTQKREEILENFLECIKKISPAAQIALITELIRSSHTNEELKLLEGLLDEVLSPPTGARTPGERNTEPNPLAPPRVVY